MGIKKDNFNLSRQFVSIDELIFELTNLDGITEEEVFVWLLDKKILDELTLFERNLTTKIVSEVVRTKPFTKAMARQFADNAEKDARDKMAATRSIKNMGNFALRNAEIMSDYFEQLTPFILAAPSLSEDDRYKWRIKFESHSEEYYLDGEDLNIGWKRQELSAFFKKYDIELNPIIEYPTDEERRRYLGLKWMKRNPPIRTGIECKITTPDNRANVSSTENTKLKQHIEDLEQQLKQENETLKAKIVDLERKLNSHLDIRKEKTYQNLIIALLDYIKGEQSLGIESHPHFTNETALIDFIDEKYKGYDGLSKSNLSRKLPAIKVSFKKQ